MGSNQPALLLFQENRMYLSVHCNIFKYVNFFYCLECSEIAF